MRELLLLIKKNIVLLIRSKASALIVIFAPMLLISLIGISYDNFSGYGLTIGMYADDFGSDVTSLEDSLRKEHGYNTIQYASIDECLDDARANTVHACLDLPSSFSVSDNSAKEVVFYVDQSRVNLVWIIQQTLEEEFNLKTQELSEGLLEGLLGTVFTVQDGLSTQSQSLQNVKTAQSSASSSISSISLEVDEDSNEKVIDTFQTYMLSKFSESLEYITELEVSVGEIENISSEEEETMELAIYNLKTEISNAQTLVEGSQQYSLGEIKTIMSDLEDSISKANNDASLASSSLDSAASLLTDAVAAIDEYSSELSSIKVTDSETLSAPLVTRIETLSDESSKFNYLFPSILALVGMFLAIMLANTLVMMEKKSPAYIRNVLLPISKVKFIVANFFSTLILVAIQIFILLLVSLIFMEEVTFGGFIIIFIALLCGVAVFSLIGMVIGSIFSSEETSVLASISTGSLFLFLSGVIIPIEGMAPSLREITKLNPYVILEGIIREVFIFENPIGSYVEPLLLLLLYAVLLFIVILIADLFLHKNLVHKFLHKKHKKGRKTKKGKKRKIDPSKVNLNGPITKNSPENSVHAGIRRPR